MHPISNGRIDDWLQLMDHDAFAAFELVTGTLHGKHGSFVLQHKGTMRQGAYAMDISVVPDSGTGDLAGITGGMTIIIKGSEHSYEFSYSFR